MKPPVYLLPLISSFEGNANTEAAIQMGKYMRNLFPFFGIKAPLRTNIYREFKNKNGIFPKLYKDKIVRWCWQAPQREYQYFAMEFLKKSSKNEPQEVIALYEYMIVNKSWWDTVDFIAANLLGTYFIAYPEMTTRTTQRWMESGNIWLQRSCLLFQLKYKAQTDTELLHNFILQLSTSKEFFIRKAIGWVLREYSKTNPNFVVNYVNNNSIAALSKKEALLWMNKKGIP